MAFGVAAAGLNILYLYLTGFSESIVKRVRSLTRFGFFCDTAFNVNISYCDILPVVRAAQSTDFLSSIAMLIRQHAAKLVIIDSARIVFEKLEEFNRGVETLRKMTEFVSQQNIVALLAGQYRQDDVVRQPQFAFADGIILLTPPYESPDEKRYIRVLKMRGVAHSSTAREFRIGPPGVEVLVHGQADAGAEPSAA